MTTATKEIEPGALAIVSKTPPDEVRSKRRAEAMVALAEQMEVKTQDDYDRAASELRTIITMHTELEAERVSFTGPLNLLLDRMNARFQPYLKALRGDGKKGTVSAESVIKDKMAAFLAEQERLVRVERERAEAVARAERERLEREAAELRRKAEAEAAELRRQEEARAAAARAEQQRIEAEAAAVRGKKAKAEAEERARVAREQEAQRQAEAERLATERREQAERAAAALETTAAVTIAQPTTVAVHKGAGISTPETADYELEDQLSLMKHIVECRPDLAALFELVPSKMRAHLKMQGLATRLPGVRVFRKIGITVR